jgi:hypothetical protein
MWMVRTAARLWVGRRCSRYQVLMALLGRDAWRIMGVLDVHD